VNGVHGSDTLALYARDELTRRDLRAAAGRAGLDVCELTADPASLQQSYLPRTAVRAPGGLVAQALRLGAAIRLSGPNSNWFAALGPEITGRTWLSMHPGQAREVLADRSAFIKLADAKRRDVPARRYGEVAEFDATMHRLGNPELLQLLVTTTWLQIDSEYRIFAAGRDALTLSPYRVQDDPWTPLLRTHHGSFHDDALRFVAEVLAGLPQRDVPPSVVFDVARLSDGRYVVVEANQSWSSGLYGCDPDAVLAAVLAANAPDAPGPDERWLWTPDPALADREQ
jgi:hypothetical protein